MVWQMVAKHVIFSLLTYNIQPHLFLYKPLLYTDLEGVVTSGHVTTMADTILSAIARNPVLHANVSVGNWSAVASYGLSKWLCLSIANPVVPTVYFFTTNAVAKFTQN